MKGTSIKYLSNMYKSVLALVALTVWLWPGTVLAHAFDTGAVRDSVVRVISSKGTMGTAFVLNDDGYLVTNAHIVGKEGKLKIVSPKLGKAMEASVVYADPELDIAILQVKGLKLPAVTLVKAVPAAGSEVFTLGYPGAADYGYWSDVGERAVSVTLSGGWLSRVFESAWSGSSRKLSIIQHGAPISPGAAGSPLFDSCGRVIGINTQGYRDAQGIFWASNIQEAMRLLDERNISYQSTGASCS